MTDSFEGYRIGHIPTAEVPKVWLRVAGMLEPAVQRSNGRWDMPTLFEALCEGRQLLWVAYDEEGQFKAVMTTQIVSYPKMKMVAMQFGGGTEMYEWGHKFLDVMEDYAKAVGAGGVETMARPGFKEFYRKRGGYKGSYILFEKMLQRNDE